MRYDTIIHGGTVVTAADTFAADIGIRNGRIATLGTDLGDADAIIDAPDEKSPLHAWHGKSALDVPLGVDTARGMGTMLGTCCLTIMAEGTSMVAAMHNLMQFYRHESCGQCTPCREGSGWLLRLVEKIYDGKGAMEDLDTLLDVANGTMGNTICAFGEGMAMPALGFLKAYRGEFEQFIKGERTRTADGRLSL